MMKKTGRQTLRLQDTPSIVSFASVVGQKEGEGPIGHCFDKICLDAYFGEKSWEKAESSMLKECFELCCDKLGIPPAELDMVFSGDLLNQCVGSAFALKNTGVPHFGLYGACSTMGESMTLAAMALDGGFADRVCAATSSHLLVRAAIPLSSRIRRPAGTYRAVDCHGVWRRDTAKRRRWALYHISHTRQDR